MESILLIQTPDDIEAIKPLAHASEQIGKLASRILGEGWIDDDARPFVETLLSPPWFFEALVCVALVKCRTLFAGEFDQATILTRVRAWMEINHVFDDNITEDARTSFAALVGFVAMELAQAEQYQQRN